MKIIGNSGRDALDRELVQALSRGEIWDISLNAGKCRLFTRVAERILIAREWYIYI